MRIIALTSIAFAASFLLATSALEGKDERPFWVKCRDKCVGDQNECMTKCKRNQDCERKCKAKYKVCENRCAQEAGIERPGGVMPAPK